MASTILHKHTPRMVVYDGEKYWLQSNGRYYQSGRHDAVERLLHRRVWLDTYGLIPDGYAVHHRNGDWTDNRVENLALMHISEHGRHHLAERRARDPEPERRGLIAARVRAAEWHASPEGLRWHSQHGRATWQDRQSSRAICEDCGRGYDTFFPTRSRFCSSACMQRHNYHTTPRVVGGICPRCGKTVRHKPGRPTTYCSHLCANRARTGS
jgi:hypothetical protein